MPKRIVRKDEQIRLIMECRQSGLSDYQWCQRQDINVGTFYNWVSKLRKAGYTFPVSKSKSEGAVVVQDGVKVNLVSEDMSSSVIEQNTRPLAVASTSSVKPLELIEPEVVSLPKKSRKKKPTLKEQFENLPTRQVPVDTLSDEDKICSICGTQMVPIGTEIIRTEIVYTRPKLERIEYIATTYGCPQCKDTEEPQFIKDNGRPPFIEGSYVSESLLSLIAYQKYGLYLPLYRQEKDFLQLNAPISRSTMAKNLITAAQEYLFTADV